MKWFKHDSDANLDNKLQHLMADYGLEGYGLYWYCLELIVNKVDSNNINFDLKHDAKIIAKNTGSSEEKVSTIMSKMVELGLFEQTHPFGDMKSVITCLKLAHRLDSSQTSNKNMRTIIQQIKEKGTKSHDPVMLDKIRKEKTIVHSDTLDDFEKFYLAYPRKQKKERAMKAWLKHKPDIDVVLKALSSQMKNDIRFTNYLLDKKKNKDYRPMPSTWLNDQEWLNEQKPTYQQLRTEN